MRPWTAKLGQGHGSSLMAPNPFLSHHVPRRRTCAATSQRTSYFPQYYSQPLMAKFTEDCLPQKCWRKGHFLQPSGHPVTDFSTWTMFYSASQLAGQDELLIRLGQSEQQFSDIMTGRMQECMQWTITVLHPHST